jgi:hypothetical protein
LHSADFMFEIYDSAGVLQIFHQSAFIYPDLPFAMFPLSTLANSVPLIFIAHWTLPVFAFCSH